MVCVDLTTDQIEYLISTMESAYFWNTETPTLHEGYTAELYEVLTKALAESTQKEVKSLTRFENIIR